MFWIFATAVLLCAVGSPGFRKWLAWSAGGIVALALLVWIGSL